MSAHEGSFQESAEINISADGQSDPLVPPSFNDTQSSSEYDVPPMPEDDGTQSVGTSTESEGLCQKLLGIKSQIESKLDEAASANALSLAQARNIDSAGVQGVGISSVIPGQSSLVVYVESEADQEQVKRELVDTMGVSAASSDDVIVEVEVTGPIEAYTTNRSGFRPAPGGASAGHFRITAGTIGGWVRGRSGNRTRRLMMLSNNHVLANSNSAAFGDTILQPGTADGGQNPADRVAILERFVSINFASGARNFVDCATGWCWPDRVRRDHVYHGNSSTAKFFKVGNTLKEPAQNMVVGKTGRTTDLTQGMIQAVGVSVNVNFGAGRVGHFRDQFSVRSTRGGNFSAGGDSGSIVWEWSTGVSPVGLLFAGGGGTTFCNRMSRVVSALDIRFDHLT